MKRYRRLPEPEFLPKPQERAVFEEKYVRYVFYLCLLGATDLQISQALGISVSAIENWKRNRPEFLDAIKSGKIMADAKVSHSLYQAAIGYSHRDTIVLSNKIKEYGPDGKVVSERTEPLLVEVVKHYPPNVTAALKWLAARQPALWSDKIEVKAKFSVTHDIDLSNFSDEELQLMNKIGLDQLLSAKKAEEAENAEYTEIE